MLSCRKSFLLKNSMTRRLSHKCRIWSIIRPISESKATKTKTTWCNMSSKLSGWETNARLMIRQSSVTNSTSKYSRCWRMSKLMRYACAWTRSYKVRHHPQPQKPNKTRVCHFFRWLCPSQSFCTIWARKFHEWSHLWLTRPFTWTLRTSLT